MLKEYKEKGEFAFTSGAVPVINFSDDDDIEEITKNNARDLLDQDDDYDMINEINSMHKRSNSDSNFETVFSHQINGYNKNDDSSCSRNSEQHVDKDSNADNDFKVFMYLEDKNEVGDDEPQSKSKFNTKENPVQVEKKLENLFKREVPLNNIYYDKEGEQLATTVKVINADQSNYFPNDMGNRNLIKNSV